MSKHRDIANQEDVFPWAGFNREFNLANHELKFYMLSMHSPIIVYHESLHILVEVSMFGLWLSHFQKWSCLLAVIDISIMFHGLTMDDSWSDYHEFPRFVTDCPLIFIDVPLISHDCPVIFQWFFNFFSRWCSNDFPWFPVIFQDFSNDFPRCPMIFQNFPVIFPLISPDFQWFSSDLSIEKVIHSMGILGWAEEVESMPQLESLDLRIHGISSRFYGDPSYILIQSIYIYIHIYI